MKIPYRNHLVAGTLMLALVLSLSCNKYKKAIVKEQYLDETIPDYSAIGVQSTNEIIHLGRVLFYDKNLSVNNSIACASCHKQELAFADNGSFSTGFENRLTKRNSIAIQNLSPAGFFFEQPALFWDGRELDLASLISKPIANHIEMGMDNETQLLEKLNALPYLQTLVGKAYGENEKLTMERLSTSMAFFLSAIRTSNSKFDQGAMNGNPAMLMNALETKGKQLFQTTYQCNNCHNPSLGGYTSSGFVNIGLDINPADPGRMNISKNSADRGAFKVPDLHNVALTAPYMHDGRFKTLDEVLEHYSHGIQDNEQLDTRLKNQDGSAKKFNITDEDKVALIAFLNTLTDYTVLTNPMLSSPFKYR